MLRSFTIGKLFGIPLYIHSTFLLLPVWMLLTNPTSSVASALLMMVWLVGLFSCVVLHELGHALMARFFGIGTESITLYPIGGVARLQRMSEKPAEEVAIALAGPAVNLALAALLAPAAFLALWAGALRPGELFTPERGAAVVVGQMACMLWSANVIMLLFNLLPCFPMDGGRVLRALLTLGMGRLRATEMSVRVGLVMAILIACLSPLLMSPMPLILAVFVFFVGQVELAGVRQIEARRRTAEPVPEALPVEPADAVPTLHRPHASFSGVAWDGRYRVWVRWHNGQPVAYWG
jgi:Zn-dependent protease